jgi:hypothetical protein
VCVCVVTHTHTNLHSYYLCSIAYSISMPSGASPRTLANFTRDPVQGPVRSLQRTSWERTPHLLKHYSATAAAARKDLPGGSCARPLNITQQLGATTLGLPRSPEKQSAANIKSTGMKSDSSVGFVGPPIEVFFDIAFQCSCNEYWHDWSETYSQRCRRYARTPRPTEQGLD